MLHASLRLPALPAARPAGLARPGGTLRGLRLLIANAGSRRPAASGPVLSATTVAQSSASGGASGGSRPYVRHAPEFRCRALTALTTSTGRPPAHKEVWEHEGRQVKLGTWLKRRREDQRKGLLRAQLQRGIEAAVGSVLAAGMWEPNPRFSASFMCDAMAALAAAEERAPKCREVVEYKGHQVALGAWLSKRRAEQKRGKLDAQLQRDIEAAVGPKLAEGLWVPHLAEQLQVLLALADFGAARRRLPKGRKDDGWQHEGRQWNLGEWLCRKRRLLRQGTLDPQLKRDIEAAVGPVLAAGMWEHRR